MPGARIVGRSTELARVGRFLDGVRSGPSALTIVGDAGIGKTALLEEANRRAEERGLVVLPIRGYEQEDTLAYVGLSDLFAARAELLPRVPRPQRTALVVALMQSDAPSP